MTLNKVLKTILFILLSLILLTPFAVIIFTNLTFIYVAKFSLSVVLLIIAVLSSIFSVVGCIYICIMSAFIIKDEIEECNARKKSEKRMQSIAESMRNEF